MKETVDVFCPSQIVAAYCLALIFLLPWVFVCFFIYSHWDGQTAVPNSVLEQVAIGAGYFNPEPAERLSFLSALIGFPLSIVAFLFLNTRFSVIQRFSQACHLVFQENLRFFTGLALGSLLVIFGLDFFFEGREYLQSLLIWNAWAIAIVIVGGGIARAVAFSPQFEKRIENGVLYSVLLLLFVMGTFGFSDGYAQYFDGHFDVPFFSLISAYFGSNVSSECSRQYGFFGHYLFPIFKFIGLSVRTYSTLMALMSVAVFFAMKLTLDRLVASSWIRITAWLGYVVATYFLYLKFLKQYFEQQGISAFLDPYFQYHPVRSLLPVLVPIFLLIQDRLRDRRFEFFFSAFFGFMLFWNFDTSVVAVGTWLLVQVYVRWTKGGRGATEVACHFGATLLGLGLFCLSFIGISNFQLSHLFQVQEIFYINGFLMLPMPLLHPWNLLVLIYLTALVLSLVKLSKTQKSLEDRLIFALSILGLGLFAYYQGRSHNRTFTAVCWPGFIIGAVFLDRILRDYPRVVRATGLIVLMGLLIQIIGNSWLMKETLASHILGRENPVVEVEYAFLKERLRKQDPLLVFSFHASTVYAELGQEPAFCSAFSEMFMKADYRRLLNSLVAQNGNLQIVVDTQWLAMANQKPEWTEILSVLNSKFKVVERSPRQTFMLLAANR